MSNPPNSRRTLRFLSLAIFVGALSAIALAGASDNCTETYPECPDEVELGTPTPSTLCTPQTGPDDEPVEGPIDFTLMTCEGHSNDCGTAEGCNILTFRLVQANLVNCTDTKQFCIAQGTGSGTPVSSGRKCSDYTPCAGVTNPSPLPYPMYGPYYPNTPKPL